MHFSHTNFYTLVRKALFTAALLLVATFMSGCFDIEEKMSLNKDGSGTYQMKIDMTEFGEMMASMGAGDNNEFIESMDSTMRVTAEELRGASGISNVMTKSEDFIITLSYDFKNIEAVNEAQTSMNGESPMMGGGSTSAFKLDTRKRIFTRMAPDMSDALGEMGGEEESMEMAKMMLKDATYTMTYKFPGRVKKMTNKDAIIQEDEKTVVLETSFLDLIEERAEVNNEITYRRR